MLHQVSSITSLWKPLMYKIHEGKGASPHSGRLSVFQTSDMFYQNNQVCLYMPDMTDTHKTHEPCSDAEIAVKYSLPNVPGVCQTHLWYFCGQDLLLAGACRLSNMNIAAHTYCQESSRFGHETVCSFICHHSYP